MAGNRRNWVADALVVTSGGLIIYGVLFLARCISIALTLMLTLGAVGLLLPSSMSLLEGMRWDSASHIVSWCASRFYVLAMSCLLFQACRIRSTVRETARRADQHSLILGGLLNYFEVVPRHPDAKPEPLPLSDVFREDWRQFKSLEWLPPFASAAREYVHFRVYETQFVRHDQAATLREDLSRATEPAES